MVNPIHVNTEIMQALAATLSLSNVIPADLRAHVRFANRLAQMSLGLTDEEQTVMQYMIVLILTDIAHACLAASRSLKLQGEIRVSEEE